MGCSVPIDNPFILITKGEPSIMKKLTTLILALALMMTMFIMPATASAGEITDLVTYQTTSQEMSHFNMFYTQSKTESDVLANCLDTLLTNDATGALIPNAAKNYYSEDGGKTWVFELNEGMTWYDYQGNYKADVVAEDWLWGLEYCLNFAKNEAVNVSMPAQMITGAQEYYDYTKNLAETEGMEAAMALGLEKFLEIVGIEAPDQYTLIYHCLSQMPYFPSLATYSCLYPVSGQMLAEMGAENYRAVTHDTLWYNGPYTITTFVQNNEKVLTAAPNYWNAENVKRFDTVTVKMVESDTVAFNMFQTGEIDNITLNEANLNTIANSSSNEFHDYLVETVPDKFSYFLVFNFGKSNEDGTPDTNWNTAIANEAFRLSMYYGLDMTDYLSRYNAINPLSCELQTYTAKGVAVAPDGRDYTELVMERTGIKPNGETYSRLNAELAASYKAQAIEELTAAGVTFPVEMVQYIKGDNQTQKDTADVFAQIISDCLGDDYIKLVTKTYVASSTKEVLQPGLGSIVSPAWGADFGDPVNFLSQYTYNTVNAFFSEDYAHFDKVTDEKLIADLTTFTEMVAEADAITDDLQARYEKFADAEAYMLSKGLMLPTYTTVQWQLTCVNDYSKVQAAYGVQPARYINWETNDQIYTSEEWAEFSK